MTDMKENSFKFTIYAKEIKTCIMGDQCKHTPKDPIPPIGVGESSGEADERQKNKEMQVQKSSEEI